MCEECAVVLRKIHVSRLDSGANMGPPLRTVCV